jgi:hypothetical protein
MGMQAEKRMAAATTLLMEAQWSSRNDTNSTTDHMTPAIVSVNTPHSQPGICHRQGLGFRV